MGRYGNKIRFGGVQFSKFLIDVGDFQLPLDQLASDFVEFFYFFGLVFRFG